MIANLVRARQPIYSRGKFIKFHYWGHDNGGFTGPINGDLRQESTQSSGILDKNGKVIFDGDIVEVAESKLDRGIGVVERDEGGQRVRMHYYPDRLPQHRLIKSPSLSLYVHAWKWAMHVIGNIYENPKLLSGGK